MPTAVRAPKEAAAAAANGAEEAGQGDGDGEPMDAAVLTKGEGAAEEDVAEKAGDVDGEPMDAAALTKGEGAAAEETEEKEEETNEVPKEEGETTTTPTTTKRGRGRPREVASRSRVGRKRKEYSAFDSDDDNDDVALAVSMATKKVKAAKTAKKKTPTKRKKTTKAATTKPTKKRARTSSTGGSNKSPKRKAAAKATKAMAKAFDDSDDDDDETVSEESDDEIPLAVAMASKSTKKKTPKKKTTTTKKRGRGGTATKASSTTKKKKKTTKEPKKKKKPKRITFPVKLDVPDGSPLGLVVERKYVDDDGNVQEDGGGGEGGGGGEECTVVQRVVPKSPSDVANVQPGDVLAYPGSNGARYVPYDLFLTMCKKPPVVDGGGRSPPRAPVVFDVLRLVDDDCDDGDGGKKGGGKKGAASSPAAKKRMKKGANKNAAKLWKEIDAKQRERELSIQNSAAAAEKGSTSFAGNFAVNWKKNFDKLAVYKDQLGTNAVPKLLRQWCSRQRLEYRKYNRGLASKLTKERIDLLDSIGFVWMRQRRFKDDDGLDELVKKEGLEESDSDEYETDTDDDDDDDDGGGSSASDDEEEEGGRRIKRRPTRSPKNAKWDDRLQELKDYKAEHGDLKVPPKYPPNQSLAHWVTKQKQDYNKLQRGKPSAMTVDKIKALEEIGFAWSVALPNQYSGGKHAQWEERFKELQSYKDEHGHTNVTRKDKFNPKLGEWADRQRSEHELWTEGLPSKMTEERASSLDDLGFVWDADDIYWNEKLDELRRYKQTHDGNVNVPFTYSEDPRKNERYQKDGLGRWVDMQRQEYRIMNMGMASDMTEGRVAALEELGFVWKLKDL